MYIIKKVAENELYSWGNKREDDFQKYLPSNLETSQANLELYLCPDECCISSGVTGNHFVPRDDAGTIVMDEFSSADWTDPANPVYSGLVATHPTQLVAWPYDENGVHTPPAQFTP